jgi:hypothetical protein
MDHHVLNVALNGRHYCRVDFGTDSREEALKKARQVRALFAQGSGWDLTLTAWNETGRHVDF